MDTFSFGYDDNLGLPSDFSAEIGCEIIPYHELGKMIDAFTTQQIAGMFIPAGTLPYLKHYNIIAQSLFGPENNTFLQSNFVSAKKMTISEIPNLTLGRVNQYCTTSFWSPMIHLMNLLPANTSLTFKNTNGFQDLLHQAAQQDIDCAMVWDIIMQENRNDANKVHELFNKKDLPTPVIVVGENFPSIAKEKITKFKTKDVKAFFNGYQMPDTDAINQFILDMKKASDHFNIIIKN